MEKHWNYPIIRNLELSHWLESIHLIKGQLHVCSWGVNFNMSFFHSVRRCQIALLIHCPDLLVLHVVTKWELQPADAVTDTCSHLCWSLVMHAFVPVVGCEHIYHMLCLNMRECGRIHNHNSKIHIILFFLFFFNQMPSLVFYLGLCCNSVSLFGQNSWCSKP